MRTAVLGSAAVGLEVNGGGAGGTAGECPGTSLVTLRLFTGDAALRVGPIYNNIFTLYTHTESSSLTTEHNI